MIFPQVAIIWWDESKVTNPKAFDASVFVNPERPAKMITNGQLVIVTCPEQDSDDTFTIDLLRNDRDGDFIAYKENLIFLGEL